MNDHRLLTVNFSTDDIAKIINTIKKLMVMKKQVFSSKLCSYPKQILTRARNNKKIHPEFIIFRETKLFSSNIKKFQETENPEKLSLIFQETKTLKKLLIFQETELFSLSQENLLYFRKRKPRKKFLYFLKRKIFLYFGKRKSRQNFFCFGKLNFLIFQEVAFRPRKVKRTHP